MIRVIPDMPRAKAHWVRRTSEFPDYIMVPMSDKTVVMYVPQVTQPGFVKAMDNIKRMKAGYEWKEDIGDGYERNHTGSDRADPDA